MSEIIPADLTQYIVEANKGGIFNPSFRQIVLRFPNNYGASVIRGAGTYSTLDTFEVAVIDFAESDKGTITDKTPFTSDVLTHQTGEDVQELLYKVMAYDGRKMIHE